MNNCPQHIIRKEAGLFANILAVGSTQVSSNQFRPEFIARGLAS